MPKLKSIRERAARALCKLQGFEPNITIEGAPMWVSFLPEVDAVLQAALRPDCWEAIKDAPEHLGTEHLQTPFKAPE